MNINSLVLLIQGWALEPALLPVEKLFNTKFPVKSTDKDGFNKILKVSLRKMG